MSEPTAAKPTWIDLAGRGWDDVTDDGKHLALGAMISLSALPDHLARWPEASRLARAALAATAASSKVLCQATLGGNLGLALPFGVMNPLMTLWEARIEVQRGTGISPRHLAATALQTGDQTTALAADELVRRVHLAPDSMRGRGAVQHLRLNAASPPTLSVWVWQTDAAPERVRVVVSAGTPSPQTVLARSADEAAAGLSGIPFLTDNLGPAEYRRGILPVLLRRAWAQLESART